jgi:hypothetical protein
MPPTSVPERLKEPCRSGDHRAVTDEAALQKFSISQEAVIVECNAKLGEAVKLLEGRGQ